MATTDSEAGYTAGKWWVSPSEAIRADDRGSGQYKDVAYTPMCDFIPASERSANARLIAAAPDMFEALERLLEENNSGQRRASQYAWDQAELAIAKARGAQVSA